LRKIATNIARPPKRRGTLLHEIEGTLAGSSERRLRLDLRARSHS
jgi:hypothetical protein